MKQRLWIGIMLAPVAWVIGFELNYVLVPFACQSGHIWVLHMISLLTMAAASVGALAARSAWATAGRTWHAEGATPDSRDQFLGVFGMVFSSAMMLLIVAQWLPMMFIHPCTIG